MKQTVTVAGFSAEPGTIVKGQWPVAESYDGSKVEIPVAIVNGIENGPRVWVQCSVHGDEYVGTVAVQELLSKVDPGQVAGALVVLPWSNPLAFRSGTRMAPQDGMDMNRVYPGKPLEQAMHLFSHTEIVVDKLFNELKSYDLVLDLHDGGYMGRMSSYIQYFSTGGGGGCQIKSYCLCFWHGYYLGITAGFC